MSFTVTRPVLVDDTGDWESGTVLNQAFFNAMCDSFDETIEQLRREVYALHVKEMPSARTPTKEVMRAIRLRDGGQ